VMRLELAARCAHPQSRLRGDDDGLADAHHIWSVVGGEDAAAADGGGAGSGEAAAVSHTIIAPRSTDTITPRSTDKHPRGRTWLLRVVERQQADGQRRVEALKYRHAVQPQRDIAV
jgi:hypothetical protein